MVATVLRLWFARQRGAPDLPFMGKFSTMRVCRVALASTCLMACWLMALTIKSWLVALSTAMGEGLFEREPHSGSSMVLSGGRMGK